MLTFFSIVITNLLQKKKVNCIRIDGGTLSSSRQALVNDFQEKDNIKAAVVRQFQPFIGSIHFLVGFSLFLSYNNIHCPALY